jgi:Cu/Ag efflux protein CusF
MRQHVLGIVAFALLLSVPRAAMPQARTLGSEIRVETGVVENIDAATRAVTFKKPDGTMVTTVAGPDMKRFEELKVGDKVTARFYENMIVRLKRPGESEVVSTTKNTTGAGQELPGGTRAKQKTLTVAITAVDQAASTISFNGPNNWKYTSKVQDTAALANVKVGDKVDIVWTEAMLVSVERAQ